MEDRDSALIGELLNLFYRGEYEAQMERNEHLHDRLNQVKQSLETERDRSRLMQTQIELLRAELVHMDQKFESYQLVFDRIFRYEEERVREPVELYVRQVHQVYGYMDEVLEMMEEYETDPEFDLLMETLVEDA